MNRNSQQNVVREALQGASIKLKRIVIRSLIIIAAGLIGAFIGSGMGIAALGSAIAGTVPMAVLMMYVAWRWTKG